MTTQQMNEPALDPMTACPETGLSRRGLAGLDPHWLVLAALPWLLLLARPNWVYYSVPGTIDPWVYYGFGRHLQLFLSKLFPSTYYGTRLSVILPIWLSAKLLPLHWANLVLHVGWYYAAIGALYYMLRAVTSRQTALLTCLLAGTYPLLILSLGWDYVDGPGVALFLVALAFTTAARKGGWRGWWIIPGGAAALAALVSNFVWIVLIPIAPAYALFLRRQHLGRWKIKDVLGLLLGFGVGFAGMFALFALANYCINGNAWFIGPTIDFMRSQAGKKNQWVDVSGWGWLDQAAWLNLQALAVMGSVGILLVARGGRSTPVARFWAVAVLISAAIFAALQAKGQPFLIMNYYASYLLPGSFLLIGTGLLDRSWRRPVFYGFITLLLAVGLLAVLQQVRIRPLVGLSSAWIAGASAACVLLWLAFPRRLIVSACVVALCVLISAVTLAMAIFPGAEYDGAAFYDRLDQVDRLVAANTDRQLPRFWYDAADSRSGEYTAIASVYLYGYNLVNTAFPSPEKGRLESGQYLVVLSQQEDSQQRIGRAVATLSLSANKILHQYIQSGRAGYWLDIVQLGDDPANPTPAPRAALP